MKRVSVISVASVRHVIEAYHDSLEALRSAQREVAHLGVATDRWHGAGDLDICSSQ